MDTLLWRILATRDAALVRLTESAKKADMILLLQGALKNEMEASEIAARWMVSTLEIDVKIALAQQAGDEAKHYQLIGQRLEQLGHDLSDYDPLAAGYGPLTRYLEGLTTTVERVAAAQFTREAIGYKSNELFMAFCEELGDLETASLYREHIQPDEMRHHQWGKELLAKYASDDAVQKLAKDAILKTLELAEESRNLAAGRLLVETLPGC